MNESSPEAELLDVDVDALMEEIRQEVVRERATPHVAVPVPRSLPERTLSERTSWAPLDEALSIADQNSAVGNSPPHFKHYHRLLRIPGRALARLILLAAEVVTRPQRAYNISLVQAMRLLVERVRALENENDALRARLTEDSREAGSR